MSRMISPAAGRVSSEYGYRPSLAPGIPAMLHSGIDIANKTGTAIHAAYAGTVTAAGWNVLPGHSGIGIIIQNPDGEAQYYGHLSATHVKPGQTVTAGQRIGKMGATGRVTGPHLHFTVINRNGTFRNPRIDFNHHKVTPGSKPTPPAKKKTPTKATKAKATKASVSSATRAYQQRQNRWARAGLIEDGKNGSITQGWRAWVRQYQQALNGYKAVTPKLVIDGDYGKQTHNATKQMQRRNGLHADGYAGPVTIAFMRKHGSKISNRPRTR